MSVVPQFQKGTGQSDLSHNYYSNEMKKRKKTAKLKGPISADGLCAASLVFARLTFSETFFPPLCFLFCFLVLLSNQSNLSYIF